MAELNSAFDEFLSNIEPSGAAKAFAQDAHEPIREHLETDVEFGDYFRSSFLYGSYKRHTSVGDIKDVDIIVITAFNPDSITPDAALSTLKEAIARHYELPGNEELQTRSIKVNNPLPDESTEMTLDIIPAIATGNDDDPILVPDRDLKEWKVSHPKGHIEKTSELNSEEVSGGTYVPLVKIVRWWWKHQMAERQPDNKKPKPKGFWLECLVSEHFNPDSPTYAAGFIYFLESVVGNYTAGGGVPALQDPGLPNESISTSMSDEEFDFFLMVANESLESARSAMQEQNAVESSLLWRDVFGDLFPVSDGTEGKQSVIALGDTSHAAQPRWPRQIAYSAEITKCEGRSRKGGPTIHIRSDSSPIREDYNLTYFAKTTVPEPYEVYWQVVNTGDHAESVTGGLRGSFEGPKNPHKPLQQAESSKFTGSHWIQLFIVKNCFLVAVSNKYYLNVVNSKRKRFKIRR